ncbi:hypothetical protein MTBUT4_30043 [Magnetospirillum sp. UT-4]|nr:hypothetical protein MTBUT4_30043 [Magnetospirillum sp. UT-4]
MPLHVDRGLPGEAAVGGDGRLGAVVDPQLLHDRLDVDLDGPLEHPQRARDLLVGIAQGQQLEHLGLARGQRLEVGIEVPGLVQRRSLVAFGRLLVGDRLGRHVEFTRKHQRQHMLQNLAVGRFQHIPPGAAFDGGPDGGALAGPRNDHHRNRRQRVDELLEIRDAVQPRHHQVEKNEVQPLGLLGDAPGFLGTARLQDGHVLAVQALKRERDAIAEQGVVVGNKHYHFHCLSKGFGDRSMYKENEAVL